LLAAYLAWPLFLLDLQQEKTHENVVKGVEHFDKDSLKNVTPEEKTHLPSTEGTECEDGDVGKVASWLAVPFRGQAQRYPVSKLAGTCAATYPWQMSRHLLVRVDMRRPLTYPNIGGAGYRYFSATSLYPRTATLRKNCGMWVNKKLPIPVDELFLNGIGCSLKRIVVVFADFLLRPLIRRSCYSTTTAGTVR